MFDADIFRAMKQGGFHSGIHFEQSWNLDRESENNSPNVGGNHLVHPLYCRSSQTDAREIRGNSRHHELNIGFFSSRSSFMRANGHMVAASFSFDVMHILCTIGTSNTKLIHQCASLILL